MWSGSRPVSHVVWFEAAGTWDLTQAAHSLRINFDHRIAGNAPPSWAPHWRPVVLLCSQKGSARYVPWMDGGTPPDAPNVSFDVPFENLGFQYP